MATGIAGDSSISPRGYPATDLMAIDLRVLQILLQSQSGNVTLDELRQLRNDQAFELGLPPVPGN